jgi:hypothetical protein
MINNVRPITLSDAISNIFEKLYRVNEHIKYKNNNLGLQVIFRH